MPAKARPRRESRAESQVFIRPMCEADNDVLMALVYKGILVKQCYDVLLANLQKMNFHLTIGLVSWSAYSFYASIPFALITGIVIYPLFLFILARFVMVPVDAWFSTPDDLVQGIYQYWSKETKGRSLLVGELNGQVAAMIAVQQISPDVAEIQRLATSGEFQRRGIGTTLVRSVINLCRDSEYSELTIDVNEASVPARLLCRQVGFMEKECRNSGLGLFKAFEYRMALNENKRRRPMRRSKKHSES